MPNRDRRRNTYVLLGAFVLLALMLGAKGVAPVAAQAADAYDATFVGQYVPAQMVAGQSYPVSVVFQNTGSLTWTQEAGFILGSQNPQDNGIWNIGRVPLPAEATIAPGEQWRFEFTVKAPTTPGTYNFQWQMLQEGVRWFGQPSDTLSITVQEAGSVPPAPPVPQVPYQSMEPRRQWLPASVSWDSLVGQGECALAAMETPAPPPYAGSLVLALADPEYLLTYRPTDEALVSISATGLPTQKPWIRLAHVVVGDLKRLIDAARTETGYHLEVRSAYRSSTLQAWLFTELARTNGAATLLTAARAGHSEHQLGTTVDLLPRGHGFASFPPDVAAWLAANAHEYGFVTSYPAGVPLERLQYRYEPWHLRWVGVPLATEVRSSGMQLDTYLRVTYYNLPVYKAPDAVQSIARLYGVAK